MGLRCSLLGHSFGERSVEREREERGKEVVLVSREFETCSRCGAQRIVSESKEVTTVEPADDVGLGEADDGGNAVASGGDASAGPTGTTGTAGASSGTGDTFAGEEFESPDDPAEEDAEILGEETEREPGQWPDEEARETPVEGDDAAGTVEAASTTDRFRCPSCGFSASASGSSLREGDSCPECQDDYLVGERNG